MRRINFWGNFDKPLGDFYLNPEELKEEENFGQDEQKTDGDGAD